MDLTAICHDKHKSLSLGVCPMISSAQLYAIKRSLFIAYNQMQFFRSPLLHQLDKISLQSNTDAMITFTNRARKKHKRKMTKLQHLTDDTYSDLQIPTEILMEILMLSNDYYDHLLSMHQDLAYYQYILPQILDLLQFALLAMLLILPPNCIFFSALFNIYSTPSASILSEYYNLFDLSTARHDEFEYIYTDHELLGFMLFIMSSLQLLGCFAALFFNYNTEYIAKWMVIKNILKSTHNNSLQSTYPFELIYPFQKWCCIHRNYYLLPHSTFNNLQRLRNSVHSVFWRFVNPLGLYITYCLFKPLLSFALSVYYWQIYRFSLSDGNGVHCVFFFMMIWFFGIFLYRDALRIIVDGWIGSRISCLIIAEVYLQIYCNNNSEHKTIDNIDVMNIVLWFVAASLYKLVEYLIMNLYFKSYVQINHSTKHSLQQFIYDWYSAFFLMLVYLYGFGWLFIANPGEFFTLPQCVNSMLRLVIGGLIYIDAQLDVLIFDKNIQKMSKLDVMKHILFVHEWKLMKDWRRKLT